MTNRQDKSQSRRAAACWETKPSPLILVVDDQEHFCWVLQKVLSEAGYPVQTARTGKEALRICGVSDVAVAIIDYRLPDMNGIQLFHQLSGASCSPVGILITSYGSSTLRAEARTAGFFAYLDKPLLHSKLFECLACVMASV